MKYCKDCKYGHSECHGFACFGVGDLKEAIKICQEDNRKANHKDLVLALNFYDNCKYYKRKWHKFWIKK